MCGGVGTWSGRNRRKGKPLLAAPLALWMGNKHRQEEVGWEGGWGRESLPAGLRGTPHSLPAFAPLYVLSPPHGLLLFPTMLVV